VRKSSGTSPTEGDTKAVRAVYMFVIHTLPAQIACKSTQKK
jgi:hypothetical protein